MKKSNIIWILFLVAATVVIVTRNHKKNIYRTETGLVFGTIYNVTYQSTRPLTAEIKETMRQIDYALSMFNDSSTISRVNRNEPVAYDPLFAKVVKRSLEISEDYRTGASTTVAPLVNAWGFGFKSQQFPDSAMVDSLRQVVGYQKITLTPKGEVRKADPRVMLDCSAIAKGFAVDAVAQTLQQQGVANLMVDIGGEVYVKGQNPKLQDWRIGINKPEDDSLSVNRELQAVIRISRGAMATSGNYRNFYYKDGKKYAHTIDPHTGYPVQHSILSATVVADDCMTADAYATSFMVMGLERAEAFVRSHKRLQAFFIYAEGDTLRTFVTDGLARMLAEP